MNRGKVAVIAGLGTILTFLLALDFSIISSMLQGHGTEVLRFQSKEEPPIPQELVVDAEFRHLDVVNAFHGTRAHVPRHFKFFDNSTMFKSWSEPVMVDVHDDMDWLPGKRPLELPRDFNWRDYFKMNPDVAMRLPNNAQGAAKHYLSGGFREGRVYSRLGVKLRYSSCEPAGVITQHYTHLSAAILATLTGADLIMPPAWTPETSRRNGEDVKWKTVPFNTLWDADYIHRLWATQRQNFTTRDVLVYTLDPARVVDAVIEGRKPTALVRIIEAIRGQAANRAGEVFQKADAFAKAYLPMLVQLPCPLHLVPLSDLPLAGKVAREWRFNPALQALADSIVRALKHASNGKGFHGLHLKGVQDNTTGALSFPPPSDPGWAPLMQMCHEATFQPTSLVYVASNRLIDNEYAYRKQVAALLSPVSAHIAHQSLFLSAKQVSSLEHEQRKLVDFLVLVQSKHFVGSKDSHFSTFVREYRHLLGIAPRTTSFLTPPRDVNGTELLQPALWMP